MKTKFIPCLFFCSLFLVFFNYIIDYNSFLYMQIDGFNKIIVFPLDKFEAIVETLSILLLVSSILLIIGIILFFTKNNISFLVIFSILIFCFFIGFEYYYIPTFHFVSLKLVRYLTFLFYHIYKV